jgi:hypothetical protein
MKARLYLHIGLWCLLFVAFVGISGPVVGPAVMENRVGPIQVNRSIDAYVRALTGIEHGSEKLSDTFQRLGKTGPLIIFVRNDYAQSEFLGMMVGYVSWPREVRLIKVATPTVEKELADINPNSVAGLVFCSVDPPVWLDKRIRLGSSIVLVPLPEKGP